MHAVALVLGSFSFIEFPFSLVFFAEAIFLKSCSEMGILLPPSIDGSIDSLWQETFI